MATYSTTLVHDPLQNPSPTNHTVIEIPYTPKDPLTGFDWSCPRQLLHHLLQHPSERRSICQTARKYNTSKTAVFALTHPLLKIGLPFFPWKADSLFASQLRFVSLQQELTCQAEHHIACPIVFRAVQSRTEYFYYPQSTPAYPQPYQLPQTSPADDFEQCSIQ